MHSSGRHPLFLQITQTTTTARLFTTGVHFHEDVERIGAFSKNAGGIKFLSQLYAVDTFDNPEIGDLANELVTLATLQVANEMPTNVLRKRLRFVHQFLDIVLSEIAMTIVIKFLNRFSGLLLADSDYSWLFISVRLKSYSHSIKLLRQISYSLR